MDMHEQYVSLSNRQQSLLKQQQVTIEVLQRENDENNLKNLELMSKLQSQLDDALKSQFNEKLLAESQEMMLTKKQLQAALKEKNMLKAKNEQLTNQMKKLLREIDSKSSSVPTEKLTSYEEVIQMLENETTRLRNDLNESEDMNLNLEKKNRILNIEHDEMIKTCSAKDKEIATLRKQLEQFSNNASQTMKNTDDLQETIHTQSKQYKELKEKYDELLKAKGELQSTLMEVKWKIEEGNLKVDESLRLAEEAVTQKDAAMVREKNAMAEISRLENVVENVTQEMNAVVREEISASKDAYAKTIEKMSQNILKLEMEVNEKSLLCERDKMEAEEILRRNEKLKNRIQNFNTNDHAQLIALRSQLIEAQNEIEILSKQKEKLTCDVLNATKIFQRHKSYSATSIQKLEQNLIQCRKDKSNLIAIMEEIKDQNSSLTIQLKTVTEARNRSERNFQDKIQILTDDIQNLKTLLHKQRSNTSETNSRLISQLYANIDGYENRIQSLQSHFKTQCQIYQQKIETLQKEKDELKEQIRKNADEKHQLQLVIARTKV